MLDMGFVHDVKKVIAKLPPKRQNLMFSATMPAEIEQLAGSILRQPAFVKVDPVSSTVERIEQSLYFVSKADKRQLLPWLIRNLEPPVQNALVFSRTKHGADKIARDLVREGIPAAAIHGNKSQSARVAALEGFKAGKTKVLVATDIAARGIDISELSHVFNYDLPEVPETYVHRIGRTARAGADGTAVSFCAPEEQEYLAGIEKLNRKRIPVVTGHPWDNGPASKRIEPAAAPAQAVRQVKKEENTMEDKEKRAVRPAENGEGRRGRRSRRDAGQEQKSQRPAKGQRPGSAQPKFDPHFLTAPESVPALNSPAGRSAKPQKNAGRQAQPVQKPAVPARDGQNNAPAQPAAARSQNGKERGSASMRQGGGRSTPRTEQAAQPEARTASKAAQAAFKAQRPARSRSTAAAAREDDPGLVLISRRPPQQKFSSFEEYMAAHGGATAPIEDHSEE